MLESKITPFDWQKPLIAKQSDTLKKNRVFLCSAHTGSGKTVMALQTVKLCLRLTKLRAVLPR